MSIQTHDTKCEVGEHYEIGDLCGGGAYGKVFKATCKKTGKECAIKLVPNEEERQKYNEREVEALTRLNLSDESTRNIIQYFKSRLVFFDGVKTLCIQMELCWKDLKTFVYENRQFAPQPLHAEGSPRFYQHILKQILNGLDVIHSIGWVHRDIHPGNILIVNPNPQHISDIHVKIADFGLARHIGILPSDRKTVTFNVSNGGTIHPHVNHLSRATKNLYNSPEISSGKSYDYKVDVYSTGIVLYFISRYPTNETEWLTELNDLVEEKLDINERLSYKDDKLNSLIKNMIHKEANKRPSAKKAKAYMFPAAKDSTDAQETHDIMFYARRKNEMDLRMCYLKQFTLSALRAVIERRLRVKSFDLRQEVKVNDETRGVRIDDDEDFKNIFENATQQGHVVIVVVVEKKDEGDGKYGYDSSGDVVMELA